jgi:hypothetical protein
MTTNLAAEAESLYQTATRLQRVGLVVDRTALSPTQRRAAFALQCRAAKKADPDVSRRPPSASPTRTPGSPRFSFSLLAAISLRHLRRLRLSRNQYVCESDRDRELDQGAADMDLAPRSRRRPARGFASL